MQQPSNAFPPPALHTHHTIINKENTMNDIRENLITVLKDRYDFQRADLNVVLDACDLDEIEPVVVSITATYTVTVTFEDIMLEDDEDEYDTTDLENALDRNGDHFDSYDCEDISLERIAAQVRR